jgi:protease PrsW
MPVVEPEEKLRLAEQKELTIGWRIRLYFLSRSPHVLFWTAAIIIGIGVLIGRQLEPSKNDDGFDSPPTGHAEVRNLHQKRPSLVSELRKPKPEFPKVLEALRDEEEIDAPRAAALTKALKASRLSPQEIEIASAYITSVASALGEPGAELLYLAYQPHPQPFTNELAADLYADTGREDLALEHYQKELVVHPGAESTGRKLIELYWDKKDFAKLTELQANAAYAPLFTPEQTLELTAHSRRWSDTLGPLWTLQKSAFDEKIPVILTTVAGLVWLVLAWQMIQADSLLQFRSWGLLLAVAAGAASTFPVLFLDIFEKEVWGLTQTGSVLNDILFFVAGVGVREEACKLIAFLPFVPVLLKRRSRLEAIIFAGCVGLGFAVEENVSYFRMSNDPATAFARFLTANFFHFAATGLIGVALCDSLVNMKKKWWKLPVTFVVVALAHGFYDAFIALPILTFTALSLSCFIFLSLAFFREVSRERGPATDQLFPAATLIVGLALLVATVIACAAKQGGMDFAFESIKAGAVGLGFFIYMFFILFRDGLREEEELPVPIYQS